MAMKKKFRIPARTDGWMVTFTDMITLLFCFFVMLYALSSPDRTKIQYIFQVLSTGGEYLNTVVKQIDPETRRDGEGDSDVEPINTVGPHIQAGSITTGEEDSSINFEDLVNVIMEAAEASDFSESIEVSASPTQIRIKFENDVLFDADSFVLKESGRRALNVIIPGIKTLQNCVASVQVQGHTADIHDYARLSSVNDWDLSSLRASAVIKHMDFQKTLPGEKFLAEGFAQYKPLMSNDTNEGRAENRRVEILVNKDTTIPESELFDDIMMYDYNQKLFVTDADGNRIRKNELTHEQVIEMIKSTIRENHRTDADLEAPHVEQSGPTLGEDMINIPGDLITSVEVEGEENGNGNGNGNGNRAAENGDDTYG